MTMMLVWLMVTRVVCHTTVRVETAVQQMACSQLCRSGIAPV